MNPHFLGGFEKRAFWGALARIPLNKLPAYFGRRKDVLARKANRTIYPAPGGASNMANANKAGSNVGPSLFKNPLGYAIKNPLKTGFGALTVVGSGHQVMSETGNSVQRINNSRFMGGAGPSSGATI
jgi:hypothetical protein